MVDYIREELLRQRWVWSALLRSGQQTEKEEQPETAAAEAERLLPMEGALSGRRASFEPAVSAPAAISNRGARQKNTPARRSASAAETVSGAAAASAGTGAVGLPVYPAVQPLRPGTGRGQNVKELSHIIQRDSRRYDGGFTLY